jgi:hypothetical protein
MELIKGYVIPAEGLVEKPVILGRIGISLRYPDHSGNNYNMVLEPVIFALSNGIMR